MSKLSNAVKNDVVKKDVYDKLVTKVNAIYTSRFILKTKYDTDKSELENKIPDTSDLVKKTDYNTKIIEIEGKIPDISNLATKTALSNVKNKIPNVSSLVEKTDYSTKISSIDDKINKINPNTKNIAETFFLLFWGNVMFNNEDGILAYLIFQPLYKYFKTITNTNYILSWKSKGLSAESINHLQHLIIVLPQN